MSKNSKKVRLSVEIGWFCDEEFKLLDIVVLHRHDLDGSILIIGLTVFKFMVGLWLDRV